jgi:hypothetical protein
MKWFLNTKLYAWILKTFIPSFSFYSRLEYGNWIQIKEEIPEVCLLLTRSRYSLSSNLVPGKYSHVCIYYQGDVYEMVATGFRVIPLEDLLIHTDYICLLSVEKIGFEKITRNLLRLDTSIEYDRSFGDDEKMYCSELALEVLELDVIKRKIYYPDDFLKMGFEKILEI